MANQHWFRFKDLSVDTALKPDWKPKSLVPGIWRCVPEEKLNVDWIQYLSAKINANVNNIMLFYKPPHFNNTVAHVDLTITPGYIPRYYALNWLVDGADSEMRWYKTPLKEKAVELTPANTPYKSWPIEDVEQEDSCDIGGRLTLVRTDSPHAIFTTHQGRWCFSIRPVLLIKSNHDRGKKLLMFSNIY